MAPDLPEEPAPRNDFSTNTTLPARRWPRCQAMLVPITPPPTMIMSQLTAILESNQKANRSRPWRSCQGAQYARVFLAYGREADSLPLAFYSGNNGVLK